MNITSAVTTFTAATSIEVVNGGCAATIADGRIMYIEIDRGLLERTDLLV